MPVVCTGPDYLDAEVAALTRLLSRGGWSAHEIAQIDRATQRRSEEVRAGLRHPTAQYWTSRIQREIDDRTRMRLDFKNGWVLDRWASGCWEVVGVLGFHTISEYVAIQCEKDSIDYSDLIDYLRVRDMQRWASPKEYLEYKRARARRKVLLNWHLGNDKLAAIIDSMSSKQIRDFIVTEQAMQTGETITLHGPTKRMFDRIAAASRRSPAPPSGHSINPGMHPFKYVRNYKQRRNTQ